MSVLALAMWLAAWVSLRFHWCMPSQEVRSWPTWFAWLPVCRIQGIRNDHVEMWHLIWFTRNYLLFVWASHAYLSQACWPKKRVWHRWTMLNWIHSLPVENNSEVIYIFQSGSTESECIHLLLAHFQDMHNLKEKDNMLQYVNALAQRKFTFLDVESDTLLYAYKLLLTSTENLKSLQSAKLCADWI